MSAYGSSLSLFDDLARLVPGSHRIVMPEKVRLELEELAKGRGRAGSSARLALMLAEKIEVVPVEAKSGDEAIVKLAEGRVESTYVCTGDTRLKNILKARGIRIIGVRDYSHLDFL